MMIWYVLVAIDDDDMWESQHTELTAAARIE